MYTTAVALRSLAPGLTVTSLCDHEGVPICKDSTAWSSGGLLLGGGRLLELMTRSSWEKDPGGALESLPDSSESITTCAELQGLMIPYCEEFRWISWRNICVYCTYDMFNMLIEHDIC